MKNFPNQLFLIIVLLIFSSTAANAQCPTSINGFTSIGEFEDSKYFISNEIARPVDAQTVAESHGGYLAVISSQAENDFIQQGADGLTYIGLNDYLTEGNLEWVNGEPLSYNNINSCGFCNENSADQDFVVIQPWDGGWSFSNFWNQRKYIIEVPCGSTGGGLQVNCELNIDPADLTVIGTNDLTGNIVTWTPPTATTDCSGGIVSIEQIGGSASGSFFIAWSTFPHFVVYEIIDACGNSEICYVEFEVQGTYGSITCPDDITVNATSPDGAIVNFDDPVVTSGTCIGGNPQLISANTASGSVFPIGTTEVGYTAFFSGSNTYCQNGYYCSFNVTVVDGNTGGGCPNDISGFTTLGEFGDSKYYISNGISKPVDAQAEAASHGGYLVTVNSQAENDFIQQYADGLTYIGLTDENTEGSFEWFNGEPFSYNNINPCGFCNENSADQDYAVIQPWDGGWSFSNFWNSRKYIMEIPCSGGGGGNDNCGFITSFEMPNVYTLGSIDFREANDKYLFDLKYNGNNGPNVLYETKIFSQQGEIESSVGSQNPDGFVYEASINGLTIDLTGSLNGTMQWTQNIPVTTNDPILNEITGVRVVNDANGIWIVGAFRFGGGGNWRTFGIRTDLNGNFISQSNYIASDDFPIFLTVETNKDDGVYFLLRDGGATGVLYRTDASGNLQWTKNIIGDLVSNRISIIDETSDASALYIGINYQFIGSRIRKYNTSNGDLIWEKNLGFTDFVGSSFVSGVLTQDDGVVTLVNSAEPGTSFSDITQIVRLDAAGNEVWRNDFPVGLRSGRAIGATADGGFIFYAGNTGFGTIQGLGRIIKVNADGLFNPACANDELPDLQPSNLKTDDFNYEVGQTATLNFEINNNSLTSVNSSYTVSAFIRPNNGNATDDISIGNFTYSNTPFGITNATNDVVIPNVSEGAYKIVLKVDENNSVSELLESNNEVVSFNIQVKPAANTAPDLTLSNITNLPNSGAVGDVIFFNIDLNNIGSVTASGSYDIHFYLSDNNSFGAGDVFAGAIPTGDTPVGTIAAVPAAITVPNVAVGNYYLVAVVDVDNVIFEEEEGNNTFATLFQVSSGGGGGGCPTTLSGFTPLGEYNGSAYFLSNDVARPTDAQNTAASNGGNLAVINSQGENDFIFNQINELVYIGLNDETTEGTLAWVDGSAVGYTNFDICSFCNENTSNLDYVVMHGWNGGWSWSSVWNQRKYIVEVPCTVPLQIPNVNNTLVAFPTNENDKLTLDKLMPNPANDYIFAAVFSPSEKEVEVQIMDARGVLVKSEMIGIHKGSNTVELNIADLPSGFYMMYVPDATTKNSMLRFVKARN